MNQIIFIIVIVIIVIVVYTYVNIIDLNYEQQEFPLLVYDNIQVPLIYPPNEIIVESNTHECHNVLTPCLTHSDCNLCREGLANCQLFDEDTVIKLNEQHEVLIQAGESYCLALDRERARTCNPNTGVWLLAKTETGFALICNCLRPGLVTQLNIYEDCNFSVGCEPHGHIENINSNPITCVCNEGYVSDYNLETETPFCRPQTVRDVMYDENFFPRAPCADGQVRLDHPALNNVYRSHFRLGDICVVDPCSVDPVSGARTSGRLFYDSEAKIGGCKCPIDAGLLPVYNRHTALTGMVQTGDRLAPNACLQPFNVHMLSLQHVDYKFFWGRSDHNDTADADLIFQVFANQLNHKKYESILYPLLDTHPDSPQIITAGLSLLKISISYDVALTNGDVNPSIFQLFKEKERNVNEPACFFPGIGRCIVSNADSCIRRHAAAQVWTAETFTNSWCVLSRENSSIKIWSRATRYPRGEAPIALRLRGFFFNNERERNTIRTVMAENVVENNQIDALTQIVETFPNYSIA
ncbi:pif1 [Oxyplax ochracea nucleopolyhedrovirus]|uniref:Pif1 n=1 Tax=Oxyplax ochracea nucleopolyhedrovirus TaxID=2083176 RepID=A0A2L0WTZ5_9ABAC|nr:pif1 [Oxyplax ochracea nucleopolyhedrovirus]AVA31128.1 pif1 [Oxyplax ochracea nucleopolyhedrovirus]